MYQVNDPIRVVYQTDRARSGRTVTMEIYDETGAKDAVNFPDVVMAEIGTTGRYEGTFTPDAVGNWTVMISYGINRGHVVKQYVVGENDIDSIAEGLDSPPVVT